ncbi:MAG: hypothetical protein WD595_04695 [Waddliaceae bacterium]
MSTNITLSTHTHPPIQPSNRSELEQPSSLIQKIKRVIRRLFSAIGRFFSSLFATKEIPMKPQVVESNEPDYFQERRGSITDSASEEDYYSDDLPGLKSQGKLWHREFQGTACVPFDDPESEESSEIKYFSYVHPQTKPRHSCSNPQLYNAQHPPTTEESSSDNSLDDPDAKEPPRPEDRRGYETQTVREVKHELKTTNALRQLLLRQNQSASASEENVSAQQVEHSESKEVNREITFDSCTCERCEVFNFKDVQTYLDYYEDIFLGDLPPDDELNYVGFASGGMAHDIKFIESLVKMGYKKINISLIDPIYQEDTQKSKKMAELFQKTFQENDSIELTVTLFSSADEYKETGRSIDFLTCIGFDTHPLPMRDFETINQLMHKKSHHISFWPKLGSLKIRRGPSFANEAKYQIYISEVFTWILSKNRRKSEEFIWRKASAEEIIEIISDYSDNLLSELNRNASLLGS